MIMLRQFIVAPSLARLIQKERGDEGVLADYFPDRLHQSAYVRVEEYRSSLIHLSIGSYRIELQRCIEPAPLLLASLEMKEGE
jgi:hypothetical protein